MKSTRVHFFVPILLASALASVAPLPATSSQNLQGSQSANHPEVKTFAGTITLSNGKYVLEDPSAKRSYYLDDAKAAKKFEGKMVVVTGTLDSSTHTIRVQKIEPAT